MIADAGSGILAFGSGVSMLSVLATGVSATGVSAIAKSRSIGDGLLISREGAGLSMASAMEGAADVAIDVGSGGDTAAGTAACGFAFSVDDSIQ